MNEEQFWQLIETAKNQGDTDEQLEWLTQTLGEKSVEEILEFHDTFKRFHILSYTSDLWAAAYIIMGGCSDDGFEYFRAWLIAQGKDVFEAAMREPESLIPVLEELDEEGGYPELEEMLSIPYRAYEKKTGLDHKHYYDLLKQVSAGYKYPSIEFDWEEDEDSLERKFPKLWERFGENPLD